MSKGLTETKCPFHANAKRSDIVAKLLEEDYYQPIMNGNMIDIGGHWIVELKNWYDEWSKKDLLEILMGSERYGECWCNGTL